MNKQIGGNHYLKSIQPWDAMKSWWSEAEFITYCLMTSIKYIMRKKSDKVEDLQKAIHYLEEAIRTIQGCKEEAEQFERVANGNA